LALHPEPGQTFDAFIRSRPHRPDMVRRKLYVQPLDAFPSGQSPSLERLNQFAEAFFTRAVDVLPVMHVSGSGITTRLHPSTLQTQLLTGDILALLQPQLPGDGSCVVGITMHALCPQASWNFVFGQAALHERVGVYSFARYAPHWAGTQGTDAETLMLRRSCKVLAHETTHLFGLQHCLFFACVMHGSNHLAESDARPLHFCPVDLHTLYDSVRFDVVDRYRRLLAFSREVGFADDVHWLAQRLELLQGGAPETAVSPHGHPRPQHASAPHR
jgi:archaemetzincin